jgi:two-component system, OmpR family, aerobic respiration control sensor histidine kinase ArcB
MVHVLNESFLKQVIERLPCCVFWKDINSVYLGCNTLFAHSMGLSSSLDVVGKTDNDFYATKEESEAYRADDQQVMSSQQAKINFMEQQTRKDGKQITLLTSKIPLFDDDNLVVGVLGIYSDITELKNTERDLLLTKTMLEAGNSTFVRQLIEQLPSYVFWKDVDGVYLGCNSLFAHSVGLLSSMGIMGKTDYDLPWSTEESDAYRADDKRVMDSKQPKINFEEKQTTKEGNEITLLTSKIPLLDHHDKVIGILGIYNDITDLKNTQRDLAIAKEQAEAYLQNAVEQIPGDISWQNKKGVYLGCNHSFAKRVGLHSPQEVIGKTDEALAFGKPSKEERLCNKKVLEQGVEEEIEETKQLLDGKQCVYLTKKLPLRNQNNEIIGVVALSFDITERRLAEQQHLETLQSFGGIVAHEMRTPLASIYAAVKGVFLQLSQLLDGVELSASKKKVYNTLSNLLNNIAFEVDASGLVINMILENAKASETRAVELNRHSIVQCVDQVLDRYPFAKKHQGIVNFNRSEDCIFLVESHVFSHILFNLIKNALYFIDAAGKGSIFIWIEKTPVANLLHFKDTGAGISEENLPKIFDKFYSRRYHGVGLGLAFCKLMMGKLGGEITCTSQLGEYTEFILSFPPVSAKKVSS